MLGTRDKNNMLSAVQLTVDLKPNLPGMFFELVICKCPHTSNCIRVSYYIKPIVILFLELLHICTCNRIVSCSP